MAATRSVPRGAGLVISIAEEWVISIGYTWEKLSDAVPRGPQSIERCGMDHNDLNTLTGIRTTAENLVHWIWDALVAAGLDEALLYSVRLWETRNGFIEIGRAERGLE